MCIWPTGGGFNITYVACVVGGIECTTQPGDRSDLGIRGREVWFRV
jgi:hypothetical protein